MTNDQTKITNSQANLEYRRKKNAEGMRQQVITFTLMIFLTVISFVAVGYGEFSGKFVVPFIILLAAIQVIFQLYYFMHMHEKEHEMPQFFIYTGVFAAFLTILAMVTIVWW